MMATNFLAENADEKIIGAIYIDFPIKGDAEGVVTELEGFGNQTPCSGRSQRGK